jgi:hypothetical protein
LTDQSLERKTAARVKVLLAVKTSASLAALTEKLAATALSDIEDRPPGFTWSGERRGR